MDRFYIVAISMLLVCLCSCNKIKKSVAEKVAELVFDTGNFNESERYRYEYDGDRLMVESSVSYKLMFEQVVDSFIWQTQYVYNDKGLLCEERRFADNELTHTYKNLYDSNDSLICSYDISSKGDTTSWHEFGYFPDGQRYVFIRTIMPGSFWDDFDSDFASDEDLLKVADELKKRDTTYFRYEYVYEENLCVEQKVYDNDYNLTEIVEYLYNNGVITEEKQYSFLALEKILNRTVRYDYSKSNKYPDEYHTDVAGQIIECLTHEFDEAGELAVITRSYDNCIEIEYYKNGMEVGNVYIDKEDNYERKESISYYDNGKVEEVKTYIKNGS